MTNEIEKKQSTLIIKITIVMGVRNIYVFVEINIPLRPRYKDISISRYSQFNSYFSSRTRT